MMEIVVGERTERMKMVKSSVRKMVIRFWGLLIERIRVEVFVIVFRQVVTIFGSLLIINLLLIIKV